MLRFGRLITRLSSHWKVHTGYVEAIKFFIYVIYVAHILSCLFFLWSELFACQGTPTCTGTAADTALTCETTNLMKDACPAACVYSLQYPEGSNAWDMDVNAPLMEMREIGDSEVLETREIGTVDLFRRNNCVPTSWRHAYSMAGLTINQMEPYSQWIQSFYWAITTMTTIGYGDRGPQNEAEILFTIVAELIGLAFFALLIQTINTLNEVLGLKEQQQKATKNKLVEQMKSNGLDDSLIAKVVKFLNFKATSKSGQAFLKDDTDFLELSDALQKQVVQQVNLPLIKEVTIFGWSQAEEEEMNNVKVIFEDANEADASLTHEDDAGNAALDRDEIEQLVKKLGVLDMPKDKLDEAMESMDSSGDNEVELEEFQNWWYTQKFKRPRMKKAPESLLLEIALNMECVPASPGDIIVARLDYAEKFFVLQNGIVVKSALKSGVTKDVVLESEDTDPFFGLQAVLSDSDFEASRAELSTIQISVQEDSYVECLSINRSHLRRALDKLEALSAKGSELQLLVEEQTRTLRIPPGAADPAMAVLMKLKSLAGDTDDSEFQETFDQIQTLRDAAWEWTGVDGNRMRGCEQLQDHAKKLTRQMTGGSPARAGGGPPESVRQRAVHARELMATKAGGGAGQAEYIVQLAGTHAEVHETNEHTKSIEMRMEFMERQMSTALQYVEHTHMIMEALADQQGVTVPPMPEHNDGTRFRPIEGEPAAEDGKPEREVLTPPRAETPVPLPARGSATSSLRSSSKEDHRSPIRRKAEAEGRTIGSFSQARP